MGGRTAEGDFSLPTLIASPEKEAKAAVTDPHYPLDRPYNVRKTVWGWGWRAGKVGKRFSASLRKFSSDGMARPQNVGDNWVRVTGERQVCSISSRGLLKCTFLSPTSDTLTQNFLSRTVCFNEAL